MWSFDWAPLVIGDAEGGIDFLSVAHVTPGCTSGPGCDRPSVSVASRGSSGNPGETPVVPF